jgi:hypothetical protein
MILFFVGVGLARARKEVQPMREINDEQRIR